ncbi:hypothetical protein [Streptomyces sp. NPDC057199]
MGATAQRPSAEALSTWTQGENMHSIRRIFSVGAAAIMLAAGVVAGSAGAAQAARSDCEGGVNGFTDIPDSLSGQGVGGAGAMVIDFPHAVASYAMQAGNVGGRQAAWGVLTTGSGSNWGSGVLAQVWMDVSNDNRQTWIQCGSFDTMTGGKRMTTPAYPTSSSSSRAFRVCARLLSQGSNSGIQCTSWW